MRVLFMVIVIAVRKVDRKRNRATLVNQKITCHFMPESNLKSHTDMLYRENQNINGGYKMLSVV